jgi:Gas vesicle synthesis protein GvpL/GvpF
MAERVDRTAAECAQDCHAQIAAVASAARVNPPQRPEAHGREADMVLNGVYLIADDCRGAFQAAVRELRHEYEPLGFEVEGTGPWPAYNFVAAATGTE